eukprot:scaffold11978_cov65-Phaeocystis_antarctica.AAC.3
MVGYGFTCLCVRPQKYLRLGFSRLSTRRAAPGWPPKRAVRDPAAWGTVRRRPAPLVSDIGLAMCRLRACVSDHRCI